MKIKVSDIKETPPNMPFNLCVFGKPNETVQEWCNYWNLKTEESGQYTNIIIPQELELSQLFDTTDYFKYMDGFSPNLNKHLHVGHLSNLIIASALYNLGIVANTIAIMGDTLDGEVSEKDAMAAYYKYCKMFNYEANIIYLASAMNYNGPMLEDGEGTYEGTRIFDINGEKIVGVKSDGSSTYFYQDVALATILDAPTLYLTGFEQDNHFNLLKKLFCETFHIGLGLVMIDGVKMSSRAGNVIYASELIDKLMKEFNDEKLVANVIVGQILKSRPDSVKNIEIEGIFDPKKSQGLYLSYTMARLKSAGLVVNHLRKFSDKRLEFALINSKDKLSPNILFKSLVDLAKEINSLYVNHHIKDNEQNQEMFQPLLDNLAYGMRRLGMHEIEKV